MSYGQYSLHTRPADESRPHRTQEPKKRLRHVFDNPAHVWAHPFKKTSSGPIGFEQDNARVAGGRWYFKTSSDGTRVIYSYRDSYVIGSRFHQGRKIIFLLRSGKPWGVTTAGHMNATRAAVPKNDKRVEVFTVPAMVHGYGHEKPGKEEHAYNLAAYIADISDAIERHAKARSSYNIRGTLNEAVSLTAELKRYAKVFKLKLPKLPAVPKLDAAKLAAIVERERIRDEKAAAKRLAERQEYEAKHRAEVDAWQNGPERCQHLDSAGTPIHTYSDRWSCERQREREEWDRTKVEKIAAWKRGENVRLQLQYSEPALLRVRTFNADEDVAGLVGRVETSMDVQVPISGPAGAARLFRFLKGLKDAGRTYQRNGHSQHIGNFVVDSFDGETLKAGCHTITWEEILSVSDAVLAAELAVS
jgi:hypothetical protein